MGTPWKGCPQKEDLAEEVWQEEEFQLSKLDYLRTLEQMVPPAWVTPTVARAVLPCYLVALPNVVIHMVKGDTSRNAPWQ